MISLTVIVPRYIEYKYKLFPTVLSKNEKNDICKDWKKWNFKFLFWFIKHSILYILNNYKNNYFRKRN